MKIIRQIEIRKFRSIKSSTKDLDCADLNVLVGQNDNGKSNVLRALNLFFNAETDVGQAFRFDEDYCYHAESGTGIRREIRIDLIIDPPAHRFKNAQLVRWTKRWKRDGSVLEDRIYLESGKPLSSKDNVSKWLDKLKYRYVPAIKGKEYFNSLMGDLHDVLLEAHDGVMSGQGAGFIEGIQEVTKSITKELDAQIGVPSAIQIPSDFRILFSNLDFGASAGGVTYHLKQRGDGIKVRHIPVILKYMADQEKSITISGYVKPDTIWGFEEPENNLELRYAFELASAFKTYSKEIQIFVTTHSPAFYSLGADHDENVRTFLVRRQSDLCSTINRVEFGRDGQIMDLHDKMGLLPIITPYLKGVFEAEQKIRLLEEKIEAAVGSNRCLVIAEDEHPVGLKAILEASGFVMSQTEFFSYKGKDQVKGALILARYLKQRRPEVFVLVHRDRDYMSDDEVEKLMAPFLKDGIGFFCTEGVDAESHLLNAGHVIALGIDHPREDIDVLISEATLEVRKQSLARMIDHYFSNNRPENNAYAKTLAELESRYDDNSERYRYSKRVLGVLEGKLQKIVKRNVNLEVCSTAIAVPELTVMAKKIWT